MKSILNFLLIIIMGLSLSFPANKTNTSIDKIPNTDSSNIKMQIIQNDISDYSTKIVKTIEINEDDNIELAEYSGNDIKILEINSDNVKISRTAIKYEVLSQTSPTNGESRKYTEDVVETVEFDKEIPIDINEMDPFGPVYEQARFSYYIKFVK